MDNEEFDDLFGGGGTLEGSSQESLTYAAANLEFCESDDEIVDEDLQTENLTTGGLQVLSNIIHQSPGIIERRKSLTTQSKSSSGNDASCFPTRASNVVANECVCLRPQHFKAC